MLRYHMITEKVAVIIEFTTASCQLKACEASCGTDDKSPKNMELAQMTVWEIFIFCCCMRTVDFNDVKVIFFADNFMSCQSS